MKNNYQILVVEDNEDIITLLGIKFRDYPTITVVYAKTLAAARDVLARIPFTLVYLDANLSGNATIAEPETLELYKEIAQAYEHRVISTTNYEPHFQIMKEHGCMLHVEKQNIPEDAARNLEAMETQTHPSQKHYTLAVGKRLIVTVIGHSVTPKGMHAFIAEITGTGPLTVKITEDSPWNNLLLGMINILGYESSMIQGSNDDQQRIIRHFAEKTNPLQSGLKSFGGTLTAITELPKELSAR